MPDHGDLETRLRAALAASRELGAEYDHAMVESIRQLVAEKDERQQRSPAPAPAIRRERRRQLPAVSLALAVPLSAITASLDHLPGLVVCWTGIVLVNLADALARRREGPAH